MPVKLRTWGFIIGAIAVVAVVLSLLFLTQQVQDAPIPTPTGPVIAVTAEITPDRLTPTDDAEADSSATPAAEATTES
jgi:hypothetical protein